MATIKTKTFNLIFVDDEISSLTLLKFALKQEIQSGKINLMTFSSGEDCLKYLEQHDVDILVLFTDIEMPLMNGFTLMEKVRDLHPQVDIFFISAYDRDDYKQQAKFMGAQGYFTKPINLKAIQAIINSYL